MRQTLSFLVPAAFSFYIMDKADGRPISRLNDGRVISSFLERQSAKRSFHDFKHDMTADLRLSKISYDEVNQELRYLYVPSKHIAGFPTVSHGGFSYSVCLSLAEEYAKHYLGGPNFSQTYLRYKAPLFVEKPYIVDLKAVDDRIEIKIIDENDTLFAEGWAKYEQKA